MTTLSVFSVHIHISGARLGQYTANTPDEAVRQSYDAVPEDLGQRIARRLGSSAPELLDARCARCGNTLGEHWQVDTNGQPNRFFCTRLDHGELAQPGRGERMEVDGEVYEGLFEPERQTLVSSETGESEP